MKTVGAILRETRQSRHLTLAQVEEATRIRKKFLEALERDDFSKLPSLSYAKGFIRNYAAFLELNASHMMAFYRRQTADISRSSLLPKGMSEPLNTSLIRLTPARFVALVVTVLVVAFISYFAIQYQRVRTPPSLTVDTPKDQSVVRDLKVEVSGKTDPDATVTINGVSSLVRSDGRFFDQVEVKPGLTGITVTATSRFGKVTEVTRTVTYLE